MSLLSHVCFLYLTRGFSNTFVRHFFVCPDTEKSPGWLDFWSNWKSSIKNARCLSRNSFDPNGAPLGCSRQQKEIIKTRRKQVLWNVILQECSYPSSLRKLHPPFQQEGGLAENSTGVIFQFQKLELKKKNKALMVVSRGKQSSHKNAGPPGALLCVCTCLAAPRPSIHVPVWGQQEARHHLEAEQEKWFFPAPVRPPGFCTAHSWYPTEYIILRHYCSWKTLQQH